MSDHSGIVYRRIAELAVNRRAPHPLSSTLLAVVLIALGAVAGLAVVAIDEMKDVHRQLRLVQAYLQVVNSAMIEADLIGPDVSALLEPEPPPQEE